MDDAASQPVVPNGAGLTKANVTGKVPMVPIRPYKGKKRSPVKMSSDKRQHVNSLMKRGMISPKAASFNGLKK